MKKSLVTALIAVLTLLLGAYVGWHTALRHLYPATMLVVEIDRTTDTVTMATETGYAFAYTGAEDTMTNDIMSVLMFDNFTPSILDDEIVAVRYSGF